MNFFILMAVSYKFYKKMDARQVMKHIFNHHDVNFQLDQVFSAENFP